MNPYKYSPLDLTKDSMRLLEVEKGWFCDDIICSLFNTQLGAEVPTYTALSYTWGSPLGSDSGIQSNNNRNNSKPCIFVDTANLCVTENLFSALQRIRRPDQTVVLWVDAICINQEDMQEKSHQVERMGNVYKSAEEVLIWLGPGNRDVDSLLDSILDIDAEATVVQARGPQQEWIHLCRQYLHKARWYLDSTVYATRVDTLQQLLRRRWFTRVWILQEVAHAKSAKVMCGSSFCPARTFALMPSLLGLTVDGHVQSVLDMMPRFRHNTWWETNRHLHFLLTKFSESQASVTRDKIYALLGISDDASSLLRFGTCYEKSDNQVFRDTASFLIFGLVLPPNHVLPDFTLDDLQLSIPTLAERTFHWALVDRGAVQDTEHLTAEYIIAALNKEQLKRHDLLLPLAQRNGQLDELNTLLNHGDISIEATFEEEYSRLTISLKEAAMKPVTLDFQTQTKNSLPPAPFKKDENMTATILRLIKNGSSKEELMRAYAWTGNTVAVQNLLQANADIRGTDKDGRTALHYAAMSGHKEVLEVLLEHGADVNGQDNFGFNGLHCTLAYAPQNAQGL